MKTLKVPLLLMVSLVAIMVATPLLHSQKPAPTDRQVSLKVDSSTKSVADSSKPLPDISKDDKLELRDIQSQFFQQEQIIKAANQQIENLRQQIAQAQQKESTEIGPKWQKKTTDMIKAAGLDSEKVEISMGEVASEIKYKEKGKK